jgi:hypothetical protein
MLRTALLACLVLPACGNESAKPAPSPPPLGSGSAQVTPPPAPPKPALPSERDPEAAKRVLAGAACPLQNDDISLSCPEREVAGKYAFEHQQSVAIAATCAELLEHSNQSVKLVAAHCLDQLTAIATTPVLGPVLDTLEAEPDVTARRAIAWGIKGAEAATAKLEDRVLALVDKLARTPEDEAAAGNVLDTLFPQYLMDTAPKPPPAAQAVVLAALARKQGDLFIRACDLVRLVEDKPAACAAVAAAIDPGASEWWRALAALNDLGAPCASHAPAAIEVALAQYAKGKIDTPEQLGRLARTFELTPELRKKAAAGVKAARKTAPEWQRKAVDAAAAELAKPWVPPQPKN